MWTSETHLSLPPLLQWGKNYCLLQKQINLQSHRLANNLVLYTHYGGTEGAAFSLWYVQQLFYVQGHMQGYYTKSGTVAELQTSFGRCATFKVSLLFLSWNKQWISIMFSYLAINFCSSAVHVCSPSCKCFNHLNSPQQSLFFKQVNMNSERRMLSTEPWVKLFLVQSLCRN